MSKFEEFSQHYSRRKTTHGRTAEPKVLKARRVKATAVPSVFQCKVSVPADRLKKEVRVRWVSNLSELKCSILPTKDNTQHQNCFITYETYTV